MVERPDEAGAAEPTPEIRPDDYGDVGVRVAGVLNAAEEAAEQIRTDARRTAEDIRRQAEADARKFASQRRREADQEAHRVIAEAQAQAQAIRDEAHVAARHIEEAGLQRQEQFRVQIRALEQRVEHALDGLRDVTAQLQSVVLDAAPDSTTTAIIEPPRAAPAPAERPAEKPWRRFGLGSRRAGEPEEEEQQQPAAPGPDVYDSLRGAVEKRGDRWVPAGAPPGEASSEGDNGTRGGSSDTSRDALLERAKELGIPGRSRMSREDLAEAVAAAEDERESPS